MLSTEQIKQQLDAVTVPANNRSITKMNLIRDITISEGKINVQLASTALVTGALDTIKHRITDTLNSLPGVDETVVSFTEMKAKELNNIRHIIAIMSGKGGVGKSLVSSLVTIALRRQGFEVGILDADITGPSIPRMFGLHLAPSGNENGILPVTTGTGIEAISINLLLPSEDDAVIWRGPLIAGAIKQFGEEVLWGNLDYLIIDLPPGTADAPLTVMQTFPISGVVIVFTPQELTAMIVRKAVKMAQQMEKPVLGVVENMSYLWVPEIKRKMEIFGKSRAQEMAQAAGAPLLAQIPIDPELAKLCDAGEIESYDSPGFQELAENIMKNFNTKS